MSLVLQGSTSGSVTLQEPAVAGSTVLSLPATSGTVALTSQLSTPAVVQVKQGQTNTRQSFGNNSWTDLTGLTIDITPTSASNKVLVIATVWINCDTASANLYARLNRSGTVIGTSSNDSSGYAGNGGYRAFNDGQDTNYAIHNVGFTWLDSPATTSALTYKIQGLTNAGTYYFNQSMTGSGYFYMYSTITVMEVTP